MAVRNWARTEEEFMDNAAMIVDPLNNGLTRLLEAVKSGAYKTGEGVYLKFLHILKNTDQHAIPFWSVFKLLLNTHNDGYQDEEAR